MYVMQEYVTENFSFIITVVFFALSFLIFVGSMIWLSLLGNNYIKHAERLPHNGQE